MNFSRDIMKMMEEEDKQEKNICRDERELFFDPNKKNGKCPKPKKKLKDCSCVHQKKKVKPPKFKDII